MKRRTFLKTIGAITGTLLVNPVEGVKAIAAQGIKPAFQHVQSGNHLFSPAMIVKEALKMLQDDLVMSQLMIDDGNEKLNEMIKEWKPNDTIKIRKPVKFKINPIDL